MKCYKVAVDYKGEILAVRWAGTQAQSIMTRNTLVAEFEVKKSDVTIESSEIPTSKAELLEFINAVSANSDLDKED
jgi:hypothetical protein